MKPVGLLERRQRRRARDELGRGRELEPPALFEPRRQIVETFALRETRQVVADRDHPGVVRRRRFEPDEAVRVAVQRFHRFVSGDGVLPHGVGSRDGRKTRRCRCIRGRGRSARPGWRRARYWSGRAASCARPECRALPAPPRSCCRAARPRCLPSRRRRQAGAARPSRAARRCQRQATTAASEAHHRRPRIRRCRCHCERSEQSHADLDVLRRDGVVG